MHNSIKTWSPIFDCDDDYGDELPESYVYGLRF